MLTGSLTRKAELPHEPGEWMELRLASWEQLKAARETRKVAAMHAAVVGVGVEGIVQLQAARAAAAKDAEPAAPSGPPSVEELLTEFDAATLLRACIVAWSYDEPVTAEAIGRLDEQTAEWAALELLRFKRDTEAAKIDRLFRAGPGAGGTGAGA